MKDKTGGPGGADEKQNSGQRHQILNGFEETDIISFGGTLDKYSTDSTARIIATYVPPFPVYPPETAWKREPFTNIPGIIINNLPGHGKIAFMPADIDRQYARFNLPDHGDLLANIIRWCSGDNIPLKVECPGLIDCNLYLKKDMVILHLVNLTSTATWRQPVDECIPVGPVRVALKLPENITAGTIRLLVASKNIPFTANGAWYNVLIDSITDHEVIVFS